MIKQYQRCVHCGTEYLYQASGMGCDRKLNDSRYCPGCMEVINKALEQVPEKFERRWIDTKDYTPAQLKEAYKEHCKKTMMHRVLPGLFKTDTFEAQESLCVPMKDPVTNRESTYNLRWWKSEKNSEEISKEVWWDIEKKCQDK